MLLKQLVELMSRPSPLAPDQVELRYHIELMNLLAYCCEQDNSTTQIRCQGLLQFEVSKEDNTRKTTII